MATGREYAAKAMEVYRMKPQAGYIWGQSGSVWTQAKQTALEKKYNSDKKKYSDYEKGAKYGKKWIGHVVYDCSGLTSKLAKDLGYTFHHGSNSSWNNDCAYKGEKKAGMKIPVGAWMYTGTKNSHGHIGIVVDDEWVVEAQGTVAGVTKTKISAAKWTYWGLAKGMEFDFIPGQESTSTKSAKTATDTKTTKQSTAKKTTATKKTPSYPTIRRGAKGELVTQLQSLLAKDGSTLEIDGIFGCGTQSAVRAFQQRHGLTVDGIVGPQTWGELLKLI